MILSGPEQNLKINYHSLKGDVIIMNYLAEGLRCKATINGMKQDWDNFTKGAVYNSPYLTVDKGIMKVNDGKSGYLIDFRGDLPVYKELKPVNKLKVFL